MTPRTSVRAAAREIYGEMTAPDGTTAAYVAPAKVAPDLMAQVRALYEDSAVPVREIAARAGITERTLYKYAFRLGWRPRYQWKDDSACMHGRGWRTAGAYEPAIGAGGRFVRREDAGKPFARGLKALDPAARAQAEACCAQTARRARIAALEAEFAMLERERRRTFRDMNAALGKIAECMEQPRRDFGMERAWQTTCQALVDSLAALRRAGAECRARLEAARREADDAQSEHSNDSAKHAENPMR